MDLNLPSSFSFETLLQSLAAVSLLTFLLSLLCIPWLVAMLPRDYFSHPGIRIKSKKSRKRWLSVAIFLLRNVVGVLLLLAGFAMLFLPGQGIITMLIGIAVMSFPYKQHLIYALSRPPSIRRSLDWLREKTGKEPFYW